MPTSRDAVEDKAARALAAAHAFLNRSPVRTTRVKDGSTSDGRLDDVDARRERVVDDARERANERDADDALASARADASVEGAVREGENAVGETRARVEANLARAFEDAKTSEDGDRRMDDAVSDAVVKDEEDVSEGNANEAEARTEVVAVPDTPTSPALELSVSDEDSDADVELSLDVTATSLVVDDENSDSEGVFAAAIKRERADAAESDVVAALREDVARLTEELERAKWAREALEARAVEAERVAAEAQSKTIETALDPSNQLTAEQVAALRAEIEQVEYLKRLLARAEQMRNSARQETKAAREKHEKDLEIIREEVAKMDAEMEKLRKRVKGDKAKLAAMERATVEAADEFATLFARYENTRRLFAASIVAILALVVRIFLSGESGLVMKNMYMY